MVLATRLDGATSETMPFLHRYVGTPVITFLTSRGKWPAGHEGQPDGLPRVPSRGRAELGPHRQRHGAGLRDADQGRRGPAYRIENIAGGYSPRIGDSKLDTWSDGWRHLKLILLLAPDLVLDRARARAGRRWAWSCSASGSRNRPGSRSARPGGSRCSSPGSRLVLGCQVFFAGAVVAHNSPMSPSAQARFKFLRAPTLARRSLALGLVLAFVGVVIDAGLFVSWVRDTAAAPTTGWRFGFASLAETLLILGGSLAVFAVVARFLTAVCRCVDAGANCRNRPIRALTAGGLRS